MSEIPSNPADQFRELADAGEDIARTLASNGATQQGQIVAALAGIVRQVADQLDTAMPES